MEKDIKVKSNKEETQRKLIEQMLEVHEELNEVMLKLQKRTRLNYGK